jgi:hypothetical protein
LNVYNFERGPSTVVVNLAATGIRDGDVPTDLSTQKPAAPVSAGSYSIALPALGYAFLRFGSEQMPEAGSDGGAPGARDAAVVAKDARSSGDARPESAPPADQATPPAEPDDVEETEQRGGCACVTGATTTDARGPWAALLLFSAVLKLRPRARRRWRGGAAFDIGPG